MSRKVLINGYTGICWAEGIYINLQKYLKAPFCLAKCPVLLSRSIPTNLQLSVRVVINSKGMHRVVVVVVVVVVAVVVVVVVKTLV